MSTTTPIRSSVDLAEQRLLFRFRCYVTRIQPQERESFFHPINTDSWLSEFCNWAKEEQDKRGPSDD